MNTAAIAHEAVDGAAAILRATRRAWRTYLRTCPVTRRGRIIRWTGYAVWTVTATAPVAVVGVVVVTGGPAVWVGCWIISVGACIGAARRPRRESDPEESAAPPQATDDEVYRATLSWLHQAVAGRNGVHLADLLDNAHAHGLLQDLDMAALRTRLEGWHIPVRQQLKVGGRNRPGVRAADLPPIPSDAHHAGELPGSTTAA